MWIITTDLLEDGKQCGVSSAKYDVRNEITLRYRFRLLDGDGQIYYEGVSDDNASQNAFCPLDDFGASHAGCSEIQYLHDGVWRRL